MRNQIKRGGLLWLRIRGASWQAQHDRETGEERAGRPPWEDQPSHLIWSHHSDSEKTLTAQSVVIISTNRLLFSVWFEERKEKRNSLCVRWPSVLMHEVWRFYSVKMALQPHRNLQRRSHNFDLMSVSLQSRLSSCEVLSCLVMGWSCGGLWWVTDALSVSGWSCRPQNIDVDVCCGLGWAVLGWAGGLTLTSVQLLHQFQPTHRLAFIRFITGDWRKYRVITFLPFSSLKISQRISLLISCQNLSSRLHINNFASRCKQNYLELAEFCNFQYGDQHHQLFYSYRSAGSDRAHLHHPGFYLPHDGRLPEVQPRPRPHHHHVSLCQQSAVPPGPPAPGSRRSPQRVRKITRNICKIFLICVKCWQIFRCFYPSSNSDVVGYQISEPGSVRWVEFNSATRTSLIISHWSLLFAILGLVYLIHSSVCVARWLLSDR